MEKVRVSRLQLAQHFERIAWLLQSEEHDSYEGSITYELDADGLFFVSGSYRINDYGGQGSVHLFIEDET